MQRKILMRLKRLRPEASMCPGKLARDCGSVLASIRAELTALADQGKIVLTQRGKAIPGGAIKGPFRVRLKK